MECLSVFLKAGAIVSSKNVRWERKFKIDEQTKYGDTLTWDEYEFRVVFSKMFILGDTMKLFELHLKRIMYILFVLLLFLSILWNQMWFMSKFNCACAWMYMDV